MKIRIININKDECCSIYFWKVKVKYDINVILKIKFILYIYIKINVINYNLNDF